jgi:hypothetical protein
LVPIYAAMCTWLVPGKIGAASSLWELIRTSTSINSSNEMLSAAFAAASSAFRCDFRTKPGGNACLYMHPFFSFSSFGLCFWGKFDELLGWRCKRVLPCPKPAKPSEKRINSMLCWRCKIDLLFGLNRFDEILTHDLKQECWYTQGWLYGVNSRRWSFLDSLLS